MIAAVLILATLAIAVVAQHIRVLVRRRSRDVASERWAQLTAEQAERERRERGQS